MTELPPDLKDGGAITALIVRALDNAYTATAANHDEEIGCDGYTFGTGVWRSSWHFLCKGFDGNSQADPMRPGNAFFLKFSDYNLYFYRDRSRGPINVRHPFTGPSRVKDSLVINNQILFGFVEPTDGADENGVPNLVVLHRGNPLQHLTEVYIGLPFTRDEIADTTWAFIERVYQKPTAPTDPTAADVIDIQPFSTREIPEIFLEDESPERDTDEGTADQ